MNRLRPADIVAGAGGLALLLALFLPWYEDLTAWQAFSVVDVLLALAALLAIALPVVTAVASGPAKPVAFAVLSSVGSILALLLVLWRLIDAPADGFGLRYGAWIGLAAALVMLGGCWGAMRDERTPGVAVPDVPRRPAP
jgi:hypothetical protein